ncbi:MAG: hypothetical protein ABL974_00860 [Prosthecobacter sp.]
MNTVLIILASITWILCGLIWTIQLVHYPLFKYVGQEQFRTYHAHHAWTISWLVIPLMLLEVVLTGWLFIAGERHVLFLLSLLGLALIWLSTWRHQLQCHLQLSRGFDMAVYRRLVRTNWWRTLGWTFRGLCLVGLVVLRFH